MNRPLVRELAVLAGIVLVGIFLRVERTGWDAISLDEMWHLALSTGRGSPQVSLPRDVLIADLPSVTNLAAAPAWWRPWTTMDRVVHPPLYVCVLRVWRDIFGETDRAAQSLSVVCSTIAILLLWHAARTSFSPAIGLWSAALMSVAPTQAFMGQEVRGYAMLLALGCWALSAAARIDRSGASRSRATELSAAALGLMLTHYFAIAAAFALIGWAIVRLRGSSRRNVLIAFVAALTVYAAIWLPFIPVQLADASAASESWLREDAGAAAAWLRCAALPTRLFAELPLNDYPWLAASAILFAAPAPFLRRRPELWLWWLWLIAVPAMLLGLDLSRHTRHLSFIRYALLASPAVYGLFAALLARLRPLAFHSLTGAVVSIGLWLAPSAYVSEAPDYAAVRHALRSLVSGDDVLVFSSAASSELHLQAMFLAASREPALWPRAVALLTKPAGASLTAQLRGRRVCILSGSTVDGASRMIPGAELIDQRAIVDEQERLLAVCTVARVH